MDINSIVSSVTSQTASTNQTKETKETEKKKTSNVGGKTIGNPQLSEKAQKYYNQLKGKYANMEFVLVSEDMKATAQAQAGSFANKNKMVVLIDEDKIERMAEDEDYRNKYEGLIAMAQNSMPEMKSAFGSVSNVKGYGMKVNDNGTATFFAVMEKSTAAQTERIQKKAAEKKAAKKAAEKKAAKKEAEERIKEKGEKSQEVDDSDEVEEFQDLFGEYKNSNVEIITASSVEELIRKVQDYNFNALSNNVLTEAEKNVGSKIDYSV